MYLDNTTMKNKEEQQQVQISISGGSDARGGMRGGNHPRSSPLSASEGDQEQPQPPPSRQRTVLLPPPPPQLSSESEEMQVGSIYEINHAVLPLADLKLVRVVMVSEKTGAYVSLRFPSTHSLQKHFTNNFTTGSNPPLDEKCMMSLDLATQLLLRRVPDSEFTEKKDSWEFWVVSSVGVEEPEEKEEREEEYPEEETILQEKAAERSPRRWSSRESEARRSTRKSKSCGTSRSPMKIKRAKCDNVKNRVVNCASKNQRKKVKSSTYRWSAERYKLAEQNMLEILKEKGAVYGNAILRPALRQEARKLIGDTGLLDHLLKDMAGRVAPGGTERFMRRHNADGAMEYWLESADLMNIRKEAGVQDPYWTPPPGWRHGNSPLPDHPICAREMKLLREEISKLKGKVQELKSGKQEERLTLENIKEMLYAELMRKKSAIEERLKEISKCQSMMKEDRESLGSAVQETNVTELDEPITPAGTEAGGDRAVVGKGKNMNTVADQDVPAADDGVEENMKRTRTPTERRADSIQRLRSGFRICKPQGTFLRPNINNDTSAYCPSPPGHHYHHQPLKGMISAAGQPTSPPLVKPWAKKCPLSLATITPGMTQNLAGRPNVITKGARIAIRSVSLSPAKRPSASSLVQHGQQSEDTSDSSGAGPSNWLALSLAATPHALSSSDSPTNRALH